ncbi:DUF11 domain-containing protein [Leifsonia shinshuensis]|uniref:DUF11 domain-containing protein n=1 Tax=Leifsonia shinshuensis TaxID=150026 RepID=A0A7G6Y745_9MICO|nr:DUF11 domain-containing protein [Leifsonia shinshuensis]QNE34310.1 DUF11 domain-containing protein [Leifsonia shinshuensis]
MTAQRTSPPGTPLTTPRRRRRSLLAGVLAALLAGAGLALPAQGAAAVDVAGSEAARQQGIVASEGRTPAVPNDPVPLFAETFSNHADGIFVTTVDAYVGSGGTTYRADPFWANTSQCNGFVLNARSTQPSGYCGDQAKEWNAVQAKAKQLGVILGQQDADDNYALSMNTSSARPPANETLMLGSSPISLAGSGRFLTVRSAFAASNDICPPSDATSPLLQYSLVDGDGVRHTVTDQPINVHSDPRGEWTSVPVDRFRGCVKAAEFVADDSALITTDTVQLEIRNLSREAAMGNDGAIDNVEILDATPQLDKSFSPQSVPVGGVSTLTFTVTNTSDFAAKKGWSFTDALPSGMTVASSPNTGGTCVADVTADPGAAQFAVANGELALDDVSCTITVDVSAAPGAYQNCAANITASAGLDLPACAAVTFEAPVALSVAKSVDTASYLPGGPLTWTVDVANAGPGDAAGARVTDVLPAAAGTFGWTCVPSAGASCATSGAGSIDDAVTIPAGGSLRYTVTGTLPADATGPITNTATVAPPAGATDTGCTPDCSASVTSTPQAAAITLLKTASASGVQDPAQAGDTIAYSFTATNTGGETLTDVTITDRLPGLGALTYSWPGAAGTLLAGETVTATAAYALSQADIDSGHVDNSAVATGNPPAGPPVESPLASTDTPLPSSSGLSSTKSADASQLSDPAAVGETIVYTFSATNDGSQTLTGVTIDDPLPGLSTLQYVWPGPAGVLQPGETVTATAAYAITQADIDRGHVANTALATGTPPTGPAVTAPPASTDTPLHVAAALALTKSADASQLGDPAAVGESIAYTFSATNTGSVTLTDVAIDDPLPGLSTLQYVWPNAAGTLVAGETVKATATYAITQADIDRGHVANTALATGTPPTGPAVTTPPAGTDTPLPSDSSLSLIKTSDTSGIGSPGAPGETIVYRFTVTNTGSTTLTGVAIDDPLPGLGTIAQAWPAADGTLRPGESMTATADYAITQADIDRGHVANTAIATGTPPSGSPVPSNPGNTDDTLPGAPALQLSKSADTSGIGSPARPGDLITFAFDLLNSGTVTLRGAQVNDPLPGLGALQYSWPGAPGVLEPGQTGTASAPYRVTQADIDRGYVHNVATPEAETPDGLPVSGEPATTTPRIPVAPALVFEKTADAQATGAVGDVIEYAFTATNTGNVTLKDVDIHDPLPGLSALSYTWPGPAGVLAPGERVTATAAYAVTQADIDAGAVANDAFADGVTVPGVPDPADPADPGRAEQYVPSNHDDTLTPLAQDAELTIVKTADASRIAEQAAAGDTLVYGFTVANVGNVTLTDVAIVDHLDGLGELQYRWPGAKGVLAPGEEATATADYLLTQADLDAGHVANLAFAEGTRPAPDADAYVTAPSETDTPLPPAAALALVKTADDSGVSSPGAVGDVVRYSFLVTNTGNVTLTDVEVVDELAGLSAPVYAWPGEKGVLAPGERVQATASYELTAADLRNGRVLNTAHAVGTPPGDGAPRVASPEDSAEVRIPQPGTALAFTGGDVAGAAVLAGILLILVGVAVRVVARRRSVAAPKAVR